MVTCITFHHCPLLVSDQLGTGTILNLTIFYLWPKNCTAQRCSFSQPFLHLALTVSLCKFPDWLLRVQVYKSIHALYTNYIPHGFTLGFAMFKNIEKHLVQKKCMICELKTFILSNIWPSKSHWGPNRNTRMHKFIFALTFSYLADTI